MTSLDSYRLLGRSGLRVSPLSLGTMTFGTDWGWVRTRTRPRAWGQACCRGCRTQRSYAVPGGARLDAAEPGGTSPILGVRTLAQLEDNLGAHEVEFSEQDVTELEEITKVELGFPHDFLSRPMPRSVMLGDVQIEPAPIPR